LSHNGTIKVVSKDELIVKEQDLAKGTLFIEINASALEDDKEKLRIGVYSGNDLIETTTTNFLGPRSYK